MDARTVFKKMQSLIDERIRATRTGNTVLVEFKTQTAATEFHALLLERDRVKCMFTWPGSK